MMKVIELRTKDITMLQAELRALLKEQLKLRIQKSIGESPKAHNFKIVRHNIARIKTIMHEKGKNK